MLIFKVSDKPTWMHIQVVLSKNCGVVVVFNCPILVNLLPP